MSSNTTIPFEMGGEVNLDMLIDIYYIFFQKKKEIERNAKGYMTVLVSVYSLWRDVAIRN
jgi:hypothetical protein